jgi:hypothetical protein
MAVRVCADCRNYFGTDDAAADCCSPRCRDRLHRRLLGRPQQETRTPAPALRRTVSVREGFGALAAQSLSPADSARRNGEREADMLIAAALGPQSRTSPRD